jgi:hypothetical protein
MVPVREQTAVEPYRRRVNRDMIPPHDHVLDNSCVR